VAADYKYIDGNNNTYVIGPGSIEYIPIKKVESSSGMYSGGAPAKATITQLQYDGIVALLDEMIEDMPNRIADRNMGCGTVIKGDEHAYVKMKSPKKAQLERELRSLVES
jgi:hypothetical protein